MSPDLKTSKKRSLRRLRKVSAPSSRPSICLPLETVPEECVGDSYSRKTTSASHQCRWQSSNGPTSHSPVAVRDFMIANVSSPTMKSIVLPKSLDPQTLPNSPSSASPVQATKPRRRLSLGSCTERFTARPPLGRVSSMEAKKPRRHPSSEDQVVALLDAALQMSDNPLPMERHSWH